MGRRRNASRYHPSSATSPFPFGWRLPAALKACNGAEPFLLTRSEVFRLSDTMLERECPAIPVATSSLRFRVPLSLAGVRTPGFSLPHRKPQWRRFLSRQASKFGCIIARPEKDCKENDEIAVYIFFVCGMKCQGPICLTMPGANDTLPLQFRRPSDRMACHEESPGIIGQGAG